LLWNLSTMDRAPSVAAARVAGVGLLFAGWLALLAERSNVMSRDQTGASLFTVGFAMLAVHVALRRRQPSSPEAAVAALFGVVAVPAGLLELFWRTPALQQSIADVVEPASVGKALTVSGFMFGLAWLLGREPRWLFVAPLALVAGIELQLTSGSLSGVGGGGGDWTRFLVLLAAVAALAGVSRAMRDAEQRNLLVAAALLVPAAYLSVPIGDGPSIVRDVAGVAFLAGMGLLAARWMTPGIGVAVLLVSLLEVVSLAQHGRSALPGIVALLAGGALTLSGLSGRVRRVTAGARAPG
jgi:hypothetical protein